MEYKFNAIEPQVRALATLRIDRQYGEGAFEELVRCVKSLFELPHHSVAARMVIKTVLDTIHQAERDLTDVQKCLTGA